MAYHNTRRGLKFEDAGSLLGVLGERCFSSGFFRSWRRLVPFWGQDMPKKKREYLGIVSLVWPSLVVCNLPKTTLYSLQWQLDHLCSLFTCLTPLLQSGWHWSHNIIDPKGVIVDYSDIHDFWLHALLLSSLDDLIDSRYELYIKLHLGLFSFSRNTFQHFLCYHCKRPSRWT